MSRPTGSAEDLARLRVHHRNGDGWLHCADEQVARVVQTRSGPVAEIRCRHWLDPLRYDRIEPAEMRRIEAAEAERTARLTGCHDEPGGTCEHRPPPVCAGG